MLREMGIQKRVAHVEMSADEVDFTATYTFEIEDGDRFYSWTGVKPERIGDKAVFDWKSGANGILVETSKTVGQKIIRVRP